MILGFRCSLILSVITLLFFSSITSNAQGFPHNDTVEMRLRPEVEPLGIRVGGSLIYPRLGFKGLYDDNIFRRDALKVEDFILVVSPEVETRSMWDRHAINFSASADLGRYHDYPTEDYDDWSIAVDGRYDAGAGAEIFGSGRIAQLHEDRSSPDTPGLAAGPTVYTVADVFARYVHRPSIVSLSADTVYTRFDFDNVDRIGGGSIDQQFRNRNEFGLEIQSGYEFASRRESILLLGGSRRDYDNPQELVGNVFAKRSSWGYHIQVGTEYDFGGIFFGELLIGYQQRNFDDQIFPTINGPDIDASINWNITPLTTIKAAVEQSIEETTAPFFSGYLKTAGSVKLDHELLRNLIVTIAGKIEKNDFEGIESAERDDYYYGAGLDFNYLMNRYAYIRAGYRYSQREEKNNLISTTLLDRNFKANQIFIQLEAQL